MKKAYILHGMGEEDFLSRPSPSNDHWLPWLQQQLVAKGYNCQTPEVPQPYKAQYQDWKNTFEIFPVDDETTLIGHSAGGGFFLRWLSENNQSVHKLLLVAPWLDLERSLGDLFKCTLDPRLMDRVGEMHMLYSSDEPVEGVKETVDLILKTYPKAKLHSFEKMGHFCLDEMGTEKFPELLQIIEP